MNTNTTTHSSPDVPLPAGAVFGDVWEGPQPERVVTGPERCVRGTAITVWTTAIQSADGHVAAQPEPPMLHLGWDQDGLTSAQARELAGLIIKAVDEMDQWAAAGRP
jgi:hypothetical protein